jgi:hypothetical protein
MKKTFVTIGILILVTGFAIFGRVVFVLAHGSDLSEDCVVKNGSLPLVISEWPCKSEKPSLSRNTQGEQDPPDEQGLSGALGFYTVVSETNIPPSMTESGTARCKLGDAVTGGGYRYLVEIPQGRGITYPDSAVLALNYPIKSELGLGEGWLIGIENRSNSTIILEVSAICADLTP